MIAAIVLATQMVCAKKVKLTIDGTTYPSMAKLWLIVNEDTANALRVPIEDAHFSVSLKVDQQAFIRLHDSKGWPERAFFVLIPDSKHITVNLRDGSVQGSSASLQLREAIDKVRKAGPEGFHIDVFGGDKEAWARAREQERAIRAEMEMRQRDLLMQTIDENADNLIPAWLYYCYEEDFNLTPQAVPHGTQTKWAKHAILKK